MSTTATAEWRVAVVNDGCFRAWVNLDSAAGTHEKCAQFIANHMPPKGYDALDIYPLTPQRLRSYILPPCTVLRRRRLKESMLKK